MQCSNAPRAMINVCGTDEMYGTALQRPQRLAFGRIKILVVHCHGEGLFKLVGGKVYFVPASCTATSIPASDCTRSPIKAHSLIGTCGTRLGNVAVRTLRPLGRHELVRQAFHLCRITRSFLAKWPFEECILLKRIGPRISVPKWTSPPSLSKVHLPTRFFYRRELKSNAKQYPQDIDAGKR